MLSPRSDSAGNRGPIVVRPASLPSRRLIVQGTLALLVLSLELLHQFDGGLQITTGIQDCF